MILKNKNFYKMAGINSQAATINGAINTTKVATSILGTTELRFRLTNNSGGRLENVAIKPGCWLFPILMLSLLEVTDDEDNISRPKIVVNQKVATFTGKHFKSFQEMISYFNAQATQVVGMKMITSDLDNFDEEIIFTRKSPTGKETTVELALEKYKISSNKAGGFEDKIIVNDISFILSRDIDIMLSGMKNATWIDFYLTVSGEDIVSELSPITSDRI